MADLCIHIWGFYNKDGTPRLPDQAAAENRVAVNVFEDVEANIVEHGGTIEKLRTTRTLDGWFVGCDFDVPAHGQTARMWHRIVTSSLPWGKRDATPNTSAPIGEETEARLKRFGTLSWAQLSDGYGHSARVVLRNVVEDLADAGKVLITTEGIRWVEVDV